VIEESFITSGLIRKKVSVGRLKCLCKNPCHGISKSIILINIYVRPLSFHKDFLDNSSRGSFTNIRVEDAWGLLDLVSENTDNLDLDKGKLSP
jgi:hypothetical protein